MKISQIRNFDVANGPGIRVSLFTSGCYHNCYQCFNKEYQDFNYGNDYTEDTIAEILELLSNEHVNGLSLLGGEPMEHPLELVELCNIVKEKYPEKNIWLWSGYTYEQIKENKYMYELFKNVDVLVDGKFVESLKNLRLKFRGSSNQRIIDVKETINNDSVVLFNI